MCCQFWSGTLLTVIGILKPREGGIICNSLSHLKHVSELFVLFWSLIQFTLPPNKQTEIKIRSILCFMVFAEKDKESSWEQYTVHSGVTEGADCPSPLLVNYPLFFKSNSGTQKEPGIMEDKPERSTPCWPAAQAPERVGLASGGHMSSSDTASPSWH